MWRADGTFLLSRVTSSARYGCLRDSGEGLLLRRLASAIPVVITAVRTLPHGVSSRWPDYQRVPPRLMASGGPFWTPPIRHAVECGFW